MGAVVGVAKLASELVYYSDFEDASTLPAHVPQCVDNTFKHTNDDPYVFDVKDSIIKGLCDTFNPAVDEKSAELMKLLRSPEYKAARGVYAHVEEASLNVGDLGDELNKFQDGPLPAPAKLGTAFKPFVIACRRHVCRSGVASFPLPGIGCFIVPKDDTVHATLVPIGLMIDAFGLLNMDGLQQAMDISIKEKSFPMAVIRVGQGLWCPYGYAPIFNTKTGAQELDAALIMPWFSQELKDACREDVWGLIAQAISAFASKNAAKKPWATMLTDLKIFLK
jgi:hypothetical protein